MSDYADGIIARIKAGEVHPSAYERLTPSFLDQAAYREHHIALHHYALTHFYGRSRSSA
ncbi:hypothetical protein BIWAKO_07036 [Bosea sp. BIWAKO-01]|nr:hypothetical protein BIWAKO_07036 [Bosea sp. BIWAKO-01]